MQPARIPQSHLDLIDGISNVAVTTLMPDGRPQTTPVWCNRDGDYLFINTMRGFRKEKNLRANSKVTLLAYDPHNPLHNLEIRGTVVEMTEVGAREHLDQLTEKYMQKAGVHFFGDSIPAELEGRYTPVKVKIFPFRIRAEG